MTDRYNALTVVLEKDMREDDAQALIAAIQQLRGVISVTGNPVDMLDYIANSRVRQDIGKQLLEILYPEHSL